MCASKRLGLVLLLCVPAALHAQSAARPCRAPALDGGFSVPERDVYPHGDDLIYSCEEGRKPAVEGWWATSTCHNGSWSHEPQCIDAKACFPPDIPNAKYTESQSGWFADKDVIRVKCDDGYEVKNREATATCTDAAWSSVPVCEKSGDACGEPPKVLHAVVVHQEHREVFPVDAAVQYECEEGYGVEGAPSETTTKVVYCIKGKWTEGPTCNRETGTGSGTGTGPGTGPGTGSGTGTGTGTGTGPAVVPGVHPGSGTQPAVIRCGAYPHVANGVVVYETPRFLKYQCNFPHVLVGPDTVWCLSNGRWSPLPTCRGAGCAVTRHSLPTTIKVSGNEFIREGSAVLFPCVWEDFTSLVQCVYGQLSYFQCCHESSRKERLC